MGTPSSRSDRYASPHRRRRRMSGFTLVEFLVAITLLGIIMVLLYGGLRVAIRSSEAVQSRTESNEEIRVAQRFLRRQLRQSRALYRNDPDTGRALAFSGEGERIEFVSPISRQLGLGGLYLFTLSAQDARGETGSLRLEWRGFRATEEDSEETQDASDAEQRRVVLVEGVRETEFSYYGEEAPGEQAEWHAEWPQDSVALPRLVRIRLEIEDRTWPELTVRLRSGVDEGRGSATVDFGPGLPFGGGLPVQTKNGNPQPAKQ